MSRMEAAAICTPGTEPAVEAELRALGLKPKPGAHGVVEFRASMRQLYLANVWLRSASRVLIRIARFRATDFAHLQARAAEIDWSAWIGEDYAPQFRVTTHASGLFHTDAIAQRLHQIVGPPSIGEPEQPFVVRIDRDVVTVSVDSSGIPLHRRGWRSEIGVAPLRPTMAAALLVMTGWTGDTALADPFCGSGTIAIEAALLASGRPPGGERRFAFHTWPSFEPGTWASVQGSVASQRRTPVPRIEAYDRDPEAVRVTTENARRADVSELIDIEERAISDMPAHEGAGLLATNPPYGKRVGVGDLRPLYQRLGTVVRERRPGWDLGIVAADRQLSRQIDGRLRPLARLGHGGIKIEFQHRVAPRPQN